MSSKDTRNTSQRSRALAAITLFGASLLTLALLWPTAAPTCAIVFVASLFAYAAPARHEPRDPGTPQ